MSVCPRVCVFKIIVRQLEGKSFAFLVVCWNDQSLLHFIYPPPLQQDKWMTPSQLYIQTHNLRMIFRHVGEYPGQRKSRKLVKTRKCTPPPLTPFSDNTLLRHVDKSCFSPWTLWTMRLTLWANSKYLHCSCQNFEEFDQNIGNCRYGSNMCCTGRGLGNVKTFSIFQQQTKKCGGPV